MQQPPRAARIKNKAAAPVQITAEQILREATERQEAEPKAPRQKITDPEELADYRLRKRKTFEDAIRRNRYQIPTWLKYAAWEESQREFERARSIYERVLDVDYRNPTIWIKYAEMEMRHKHVNHARNIWDRAVTLLPRVSQFWYKYSYMETVLGNYAGARQIFERWMEWHPDEHGWMSYIKFELKFNEYERARKIYERFVDSHPTVKSWLRFAKFEEELGNVPNARSVYERAIQALGDEANDEKLFIAFAKLEEKAKEVDRARTIYKYALDHIPKSMAQELYKMFINFEKKNGERQNIEDVIVSKRRFQYEEELKANSKNYDVWFDYIHLEESNGDVDKTREVFERSIANMPPSNEKRLWRRYIYLWINYAVFEELETKDAERAREVYKECLKQIPHQLFTFTKVWIMYAQFEIRQRNLDNARKILGTALGKSPKKEKIYQAYIQLEMQLGNIDRCRTLYSKYLEYDPTNCQAWTKFAGLEAELGEYDRARGIYELAVNQPVLDLPELLWKAFIDFEIGLKEHDRVRDLYKRLLERTKHVKVWVSFAQFEASIDEVPRARGIYEQAFQALKSSELPEERVMLLESWKDFESERGNKDTQAAVEARMPKKILKKRLVKNDDGTDSHYEEYYDYIFPGEETNQPLLKLLQKAHSWKRQKTAEDDS